MNWVKFSLAVAATSAVLVIGLVAAGGLVVGNALAAGAGAMALHNGAPGTWGPQAWQSLPPELSGLKDLPADQRFSHFKSVAVSLTDKDGKPLTIQVTPGVATATSPTSITLAGNDGATHTYTLNDQTLTKGKPLSTGEDVVVVTFDNNATARAVFAADGHH